MTCATDGCRRRRARSKSGREYSYCRPCYNSYHKAYETPTKAYILRRVELWLGMVDADAKRWIISRLKAS